MRLLVYLVAVILGATATPNGYYHQQYNYKTSSSSYKNNELQHKTDDQGYYSKDGDLEGRVKPKVSSNSEHSEYINPQLQEQHNTGYIDAEADLTSHGNMLANSYGTSIGGGVSSGYQAGSQYGRDLYSEGMASTDHIGGGSNLFGAYGSGSSQSSYGSSSLRTVASRLQNDLQQEIQEALRSQSRYSHQIDISELEAELRRNLTARLHNILQEQYGTQTIRGGQSYSLTEGRVQTRPNYEQHDLENLQRQVENSMLQQLRYEYSQGTSHSSGQQVHNQNYARYESTTTYRPTTYRPIYPNLNVITTPRPFPEYPGGSKNSYYSENEYNNNRGASNVRYTPVPNPLSITTIASNAQSQLDSQLNRLLEQAQTQYFSETSGYSAHNLDSVLERLQQELKNNLTYVLEEQLRSQYGTQMQKNNYMFSVGSGGETSSQYNYNVADLENLRRQVENNLLTKLNRDFEAARQRWVSRQQESNYAHSQSSNYIYGGSSSNNQKLGYSTPRYSEYEYYRPTSASIVPLISTGVKGNQYHTISGSQQSNYGSSGSSSNIVELQRQLQSDLSRQVQAAISQNQAYTSRYSTQGASGGSFEEAYQRLYDDLQRNLTQQLHEFEAGSSGYSQSYGRVSEAQLASLKSQLQRNLASQLQSGLQQSYSASASYSASSGSSSSAGSRVYSGSSSDGSYRAARGSQVGTSGYGQYRSGGGYLVEGEDCQGDDPNSYTAHRRKRSYRSRPLGLSTYSGSGYNNNFGESSSGSYGGGRTLDWQRHQYVGQEEDDSDTVQQVEPDAEFTGQRQIDLGQQVDNSDTQQMENHGFGNIELESQSKLQAGGHSYTQVEESNVRNQYNQPTRHSSGSYSSGRTLDGQRQHQYVGQEEDNSDIVQQVKPVAEFTGQQQIDLAQQVDNSDSQQVEIDHGFGNVELDSQNKLQAGGQLNTQFGRQNYITQVAESNVRSQYNQPTRKPFNQIGINGYETLHLESQSHTSQQDDNNDLTQQGEHVSFVNPERNRNYTRKPNMGISENLPGQRHIGQETDDSDIGQKPEDINFGNLKPTQPFGSNTETETPLGHSFSFSDPLSQIRSTTKKSLIRPFQSQVIGQEMDDTDTTQQISQSSNLGILGVSSISQTATQKPAPTNSQTNYFKPLNHETHNIDTFQQENNFQNSREINNVADLTQQLEDNTFSTSGNLLNNQEKTQPGQNKISNDYKPSTHSISTLQLSAEVKEIFEKIETNLTKQLESSIKNDISYSIAPSQLYQNILRKWQNIIYRECQKLINDHIYSLKINNSNLNQLEIYLTASFKEKIKNELQHHGFSRESLESSHVHQLDLNNQNTNVDNSFYYTGSGRYNPYFRLPSSKPTSSNDFIQREINSQSGIVTNNEPQFIDQKANPLPMHQDNDNIEQINSGQTTTHYVPTDEQIYSHRKPWSNGANYHDYTVETGKPEKIPNRPISPTFQQNLNGDRESFLITPKPFNSPTTSSETVTPQSQFKWEIGEPSYVPYIRKPKPLVTTVNSEMDQKPLEQTNTQWVDVASQPALPVDNQVINYESNLPSNPNDGKKSLSTAPNTSPINPLDISNFPPLPTPEHTAPLTPTIQPQQPPIFQKPTRWQIHTNEGQRHDQSLTDADREADLLIEKLREAQQNRQSQHINIHQQAGVNSYESNHSSRTYQHRSTVQNSPSQYNTIQVKLEVTPEQLKIINQIEKDFTEIIEAAVQKQVETGLSYQQSLKELEKELKTNLTEYVDGNVYSNLEITNTGLNKYSDLINQKFEYRKISDLKKYLEIKFVKKIREQLKNIQKVESEENTYQSQHSIVIQDDRTFNQSPTRYVKLVILENLTPSQVKIIKQMEDDFRTQTEAAIQTHLETVTLEYLSSNENYQKSFNELERQLKNNITECVQGITEPGFSSKYSDLIVEKFDQSKLVKLENYLEIRLVRNLKESLKSHFKNVAGSSLFNSHLNTDSLSYHRGDQNNYHQSTDPHRVQYGQTYNFNSGTEKALEIKPLDYQRASVVTPPSASYSGGVKGGKISQPNFNAPAIQTSYNNLHSQHNVETVPEKVELLTNPDETGEPTTENAGWWKRFGNTVKQSASKLKKKIVGDS